MKTPPFELLELLVAVAESRNLVEAARRIGLSQPAVSLKLRQLEGQVSLPVFALEGRRKVLTHYGRALYTMARSQVDGLSGAYETVNRRFLEAERLTLKMGCRPELFAHLAPRLRFPGRIEFHALSSHEAVLQLLEHKLDVAISTERPDSATIVAKKVLDSDAKLLVHRKLLPRGRTGGSELFRDKAFLRECPCLLYEQTGHLLRDLAAKVGLGLEQLKVRFVSEDWRLLSALVDQAWGYALVPSYIESRSRDVVTVPIPTSISPRFQFNALFHKDLKQISAFGRLLDGLKPD